MQVAILHALPVVDRSCAAKEPDWPAWVRRLGVVPAIDWVVPSRVAAEPGHAKRKSSLEPCCCVAKGLSLAPATPVEPYLGAP